MGFYEEETRSAEKASSYLGKTEKIRPFNPASAQPHFADSYEAVVDAVSDCGRRVRVKPTAGGRRRWVGVMAIKETEASQQ